MNSLYKTVDFYFRIAVFVCALGIAAILVMTSARQAMAATLKPSGTLTENVLTLGDIFDGLSGEKASFVLGPAPQPGQEMVLNARTLMRIALATDLPWRPASVMDQITIKRATTTIETDTIKDEVIARLQQEGVAGTYDVKFNTVIRDIVLPGNEPASLEIASLKYDSRNEQFHAVIMAPSQQNPLSRIEVSGQIERTVSIPVLGQTMRRGDIIRASDISWIEVPERSLQHDTILRDDDLVGLTPRRMLTPGKALRDLEVQQPQMVARGDTVSLIYENGPIVLTTSGRAMQNGAKGDLIRVINTASNRSIEGFISGDREVRVMAQ